jgi:nucleoside-diphosphate-sugar epimerase
MVTGASGFLGIHLVQRLLAEGHRVRAFVRSPARLRENLAPLGVDPDDPRIEVATGDMTDAAAVREAASGSDQTIHAAATFSYRRRDADRMLHQNKAGTVTVLDAAIDAGCTGIVHVSSIAALLRPGATLTHQSPLGITLGPYTQSKVESERVARDRQAAGAPVTIVNPGGILGPHDPYVGESDAVVRDILRGRLPTWPRGGMQWVDVRDTAEVVVAALGRPGGRYLVPGENVADPHETLRTLTGRRLPAVRMPLKAALPVLKLGYRTEWPLLPHAEEGARFIATDTRVDYSATVEDLGLRGRSLAESMGDTVRWLVEAGHVPAGEVSNFLHQNLFEGDEIRVSAPFGDLVLADSEGPLVLISAGIGITPIIGILHYLAATGSSREVLVLHADRSPARHAHRQELKELVEALPTATLHRWYEDLGVRPTRDVLRAGRVDLGTVEIPVDAQV